MSQPDMLQLVTQQSVTQQSAGPYESVRGIVFACIAEANVQGLCRIPLEKGDDANIMAGGRYIDSFGLVSLLVMIEQDLCDQLGHNLNLATSVAEAAANGKHPLATVSTLLDHILQQLEGVLGTGSKA